MTLKDIIKEVYESDIEVLNKAYEGDTEVLQIINNTIKAHMTAIWTALAEKRNSNS